MDNNLGGHYSSNLEEILCLTKESFQSVIWSFGRWPFHKCLLIYPILTECYTDWVLEGVVSFALTIQTWAMWLISQKLDSLCISNPEKRFVVALELFHVSMHLSDPEFCIGVTECQMGQTLAHFSLQFFGLFLLGIVSMKEYCRYTIK